MGKVAAALAVLALGSSAAWGGVWYADVDNASGTEDGLAWATAFTTIQDAIDAADISGEVWVAEGVYDRRPLSDPVLSDGPPVDTCLLALKETIRVYGGFAGTETECDQRDVEIHVTTLDGSTTRDGAPVYHVVVGAHDALIDGFTITGGHANGGGTDDLDHRNQGGGVYIWGCSTTVANCSFTGNRASSLGGGMYSGEASLILVNCTFAANSADRNGGGMYATRSWVTATQCTLRQNTSIYGGGVSTFDSSLALIQCEFIDNLANTNGGGIDAYISSLTLTQCTVVDNAAEGVDRDSNGGVGVSCQGSSVTATDCAFSGNSASPHGGGCAS